MVLAVLLLITIRLIVAFCILVVLVVVGLFEGHFYCQVGCTSGQTESQKTL